MKDGVQDCNRGSHHVLRDVHCQKTNQGGPTMWNLVSMLGTVTCKGKVEREIRVGMPHAQ